MGEQRLGYVGAGLLVIGLFLPVVTMPMVGNVTLMANGTNLAALALLALAGISAVLVAKEQQADLVWPGIASAATLAYLFGRLEYQLAHMRSEMTESLKDSPFAGVAQAAMGAVQVQWGWLVLAAGAGILVYLAVQARKAQEQPLLQVGEQGGKALLLASAVCALVAPGLDVWGLTRGDQTAPASASTDSAAVDAGAPVDAATPNDAEKTAYIRDHLTVYDLDAHYFDSILDGRVAGVDFKIKNNGNRTLNRVTVRVVFYDAQDKPIAEEEYSPVLVTSSGFGDNKPLRPNYIWKQEQGKFYSAKSVPSEWKTGKATATITEIEFGPNE